MAAQIEAQQASGLTAQQWCVENEIKPKTYYYHLKNVRAKFLDSSPAIVLLKEEGRKATAESKMWVLCMPLRLPQLHGYFAHPCR